MVQLQLYPTHVLVLRVYFRYMYYFFSPHPFLCRCFVLRATTLQTAEVFLHWNFFTSQRFVIEFAPRGKLSYLFRPQLCRCDCQVASILRTGHELPLYGSCRLSVHTLKRSSFNMGHSQSSASCTPRVVVSLCPCSTTVRGSQRRMSTRICSSWVLW